MKKSTKLALFGIIFVAGIAAFNMGINGVNNTALKTISEEEVPLGQKPNYADGEKINTDSISEIIPLTTAPISLAKAPSADGKVTYKNEKTIIDASNTADGYIMVAFTGTTTNQLKIIVTGPSASKYTYNLRSDGKYDVFPLSDSNGTYKIGIFENIEGTKYAQVFSKDISVKLGNEFAPFLLPNQYVNYNSESKAVSIAKQVTSDKKTDIEKISAVYNYVVANLTYDYDKAANVKSGYLPVIDNVLKEKKGICFDYAALMTAMLRSQEIPCKLVVGYAGTTYHAWISAYTKENGWVDQVILFDGKTWRFMDPTFASSGKGSDEILKFIKNENNYSAKYLY